MSKLSNSEIVDQLTELRGRIVILEEQVQTLTAEAEEPVAGVATDIGPGKAQSAQNEDLLDTSDAASTFPSDRRTAQVLTALSRFSQHQVEAAEEWFSELFPETCIYTLPQGALKNGRVAPGFDPILAELTRKSRGSSSSATDRVVYQSFAAEWQVLNQAIIYQIIQAEAVSELLQFVRSLKDLTPTQIADRVTAPGLLADLSQLLLIQCNVLDDQTKRASVLIAGANKSVQAATVIANQFVSTVSGVHPAAEAAYAAAKVQTEGGAREASSKFSGKQWRPRTKVSDEPVKLPKTSSSKSKSTKPSVT